MDRDIFRLEDLEYRKLLTTCCTVANHLEQALTGFQCGMIIEGSASGFACVKLIPFPGEPLEICFTKKKLSRVL